MALAQIIRPIVEGQVKAWMDAHPNDEKHPGHLVTGIGKRVTHDICSDQTVERIRLALECIREPGSAAISVQRPGKRS